MSGDDPEAADRRFLCRVQAATKHGPHGAGGPGPCDSDCLKCDAEQRQKALNEPWAAIRTGATEAPIESGAALRKCACGNSGTFPAWVHAPEACEPPRRPAIDPGSPADAADRIRAVLVAMVERSQGTDDRIAILTDALRAVEGR